MVWTPVFDPGAGASADIAAMALQADGKVLVGGNFTNMGGTAMNRIARLNANGSLDPTFVIGSGANLRVHAIRVQPDQRILIAGAFFNYSGSTYSCLVRVNTNGSVDPTFVVGTGVAGSVLGMTLQPDGRILIGGTFNQYNNVTRPRVARVNTNGSLDTSFDPGTGANNTVYTVGLRSDGKILVGGTFDTFDGVSTNKMTLLEADGDVDPSFNIGAGPTGVEVANVLGLSDGRSLAFGLFSGFNGRRSAFMVALQTTGAVDTDFVPGHGADNWVTSIIALPDGRSLVAGAFSGFNGVVTGSVIRVQANGTLDPTFQTGEEVAGLIHRIARRPDGKIVLAGGFLAYAGAGHSGVARISANGAPDMPFLADVGSGANSSVHALALQPDGKVLIGGYFTSFNGTVRNRVARLNADGTLDPTFVTTSDASFSVNHIALQTDGKIIVEGGYSRISRMHANGSRDTDFFQGVGSGAVTEVAILPNGKIMISGLFSTISGVVVNGLARLKSDGHLDCTFDSGTGVGSSTVEGLAVHADGRIVIGGTFLSYDGTGRNRLARVHGGEVAVEQATVGGPQTICRGATTAPLGGNTPIAWTGSWSIVNSNLGTFSDPSSPSSTYTSSTNSLGPLPLRWSISSGSCVLSSADVVITLTPPPSTASVGAAQTICALGTTTSLNGNAPASGTGAWGIVSGGTGTFSNPLSPNATFTHTGGAGPLLLRWTITNGACTTSANISITVPPAPTVATVGSDQPICAYGTTAALGGNTPTVGTGVWSVVGGGTGAFSNPSSPSSTFTHASGIGTIELSWTISNGACASSVAYMNIPVAPTPTTAAAGPGQTICALTNTGALGANTPTIGTGAWSIIGGGTGTFSNAASPSSTFTHTGGTGPVSLRWTISNGSCTPSTSDLSISITPRPTVATVGGPQSICTGGTTAPLGGNTPINGTGTWHVISSGTGTFSAPLSPNSTFTHATGNGPVVLRWRISNGSCPASTAHVSITITQAVTWYADTDGDGAGDPASMLAACTQPDGYVANNNDQCPLNAAKTPPGSCGCPNPEPGTACDDGSQATIEDVINENCVCAGTPLGLAVRMKVFLEGPYDGSTGLMNDALRTLPDFPLTEPYNSSGATVQPAVLSITGEDAVVDWVLVELRMAVNSAIVFSSMPGLLQRDGDVVAADGVSPITFVWPAGDYYIAIRHRNHLGCMTATPLTLSLAPTVVDFSMAATATHGTQARKSFPGATSSQVLWAGDVDADGIIKYTGSGNDRDPILSTVGSTTPNNSVSVYSTHDVNLDGLVRYTGSANDRDPILVNVGGSVPTAVRGQQLP